ncbi:MAG: aminotransferase class V-fold PLP-dependent enzyme [Pirellulaceae bacterium]|nr:aminotransferase class V-fold PLP-dependent enzyme [Pirellulaceae bacterium]
MIQNIATNGPKNPDYLRNQMVIGEELAYLDHAAVSPITRPAQVAMFRYIDQVATQGDLSWGEWAKGVEIGRERAAALLSCQIDEIAFIPNTTFGINVIAHGVPWQPGDNLVVPDNEFPSNLVPWRLLQKRGVEVRIVPTNGDLSLEQLMKFVDSRTRMVTISWVHYASGYRIDLAKFCEQIQSRGAKFFVDAIQGLGAFPLSVREIPIDFLAADGHKWMLGPEGAGLLFIRQRHLDWLEPIMMGWGSLQQSHRFDPNEKELKSQASRYEGGSANMAGLLGFAASLGVLLEAGCHQPSSGIGERIVATSHFLESGLCRLNAVVYRDPDPLRQSGIVSFEFPGHDSHRVRQILLDRNIVLSVRHGRLRAAVHAYNSKQDIERLISALSEFL